MDEVKHPHPRVEAYFGKNPLEAIMDIEDFTRYYINSAFENVLVQLTNKKIPANARENLRLQLSQEVNDKFIANCDKLELYLMRNVFNISYDLDLTQGLLTETEQEQSVEDIPITDISLDSIKAQVEQLEEQIKQQQQEYVDLIKEYNSCRVELEASKMILEEIPKMQKNIDEYRKYPEEKVKEINQNMKECLKLADEVAQKNDATRTIDFHKKAFVYE